MDLNNLTLLLNISLFVMREASGENGTTTVTVKNKSVNAYEWRFVLPPYFIIFLLSIFGNCLVIATLASNRRMRTVTNVYLLNLAISDFLLGVFCLPFTLVGQIYRRFLFGATLCKLIPFLQAISVSVDVWTLVAISLERYFAICRPLKSRKWQTQCHAYKMIATVWILSLMLNSPILVVSTLQPMKGDAYKCREVWANLELERTFNLGLDAVLLLIPFFVMSFAYCLIVTKLWRGLQHEIQHNYNWQRHLHRDVSCKGHLPAATPALNGNTELCCKVGCNVKKIKGGRTDRGCGQTAPATPGHYSITSAICVFKSMSPKPGQKPNLNVEAAIREAGSSNTVAMISVEKLQLKDVQKAMQGLKPKKATGPDGVPPYVLKDCCTVLAEPLRHIFNLSLKETIVPEVWKNSKVVPVPKGGNRSRVENYRPVAILSSPAKVMETALQRSIYSQISPYLADAQHGFRPTRSTTSNLLSYMSDIIPVVDSGGQVDAAYLDFKKAFDMVDNDILLKKFAEVGFTTHLLKLMTSLLTDRKQYVEYGGCKSKEYFTRSGVTQGSNMGPLQFLLMVNDLSGVMKNAKCLIFADDVKLSLSIENMEDCTSLQKDDRVVAGAKEIGFN
ncbi:unnamed protein product [Leptosia nina]|uniref:Uncharacterized protein n=1 Tax=Leptosia nina TaxID=320188 RepID=A0AAV1JQF4_9NEOP